MANSIMAKSKKDEYKKACIENRKALDDLLKSLNNLAEVGGNRISTFVKQVRCEDDKRTDNDRDLQ